MKRSKHWITLAIAAALAGLAMWSWAQPAPAPPGALFPAGALLYLEARDFQALLNDWDASAAKTEWLKSANYSVFANSRLIQRLISEQAQFAQAAGVPADYALLKSLAGSASALAIYDIGNLEFLYISRVGSTRGAQSALWQSRASFEPRNAGGRSYFVKSDNSRQRTAAFALADDLVIAGTRENLVAGALELLANQPRQRLQDERWFSAAAASQSEPRELRMVMNLERLAAAPHFRSYYIHGGAAGLRQFQGAVADLERQTGEWRERRTFLRSAAAPDRSTEEAGVARLLPLVPDSASVFRAWSSPEPEAAAMAVYERMLLGVPPGVRPAELTATGVDSGEERSGTEDALETRIDETLRISNRGSGVAPGITKWIASQPLIAMLHVGWTRAQAGDPFIATGQAVVLASSRNWDLQAARNALAAASGELWAVSGAAPAWQSRRAGAREFQELDGLVPVALAASGPLLMVATSPELMAELLARLDRAPASGAVYAGGFRHSLESPRFERLMKLIDFPRRPAPESGESREPFFFSENLASLSRSLARLRSVFLEEHDRGERVTQQVVYELNP
jgi:hypothetical protein